MKYPFFSEDILDREYARVTTEKHMHRRLINRHARNLELNAYWKNNPGAFQAFKARVRLGIA